MERKEDAGESQRPLFFVTRVTTERCFPVLDIINVGWMAAVIGPSIVRTPSDLASRCDSHEKYRPFIGLRKARSAADAANRRNGRARRE
jgi:hypothetical protein